MRYWHDSRKPLLWTLWVVIIFWTIQTLGSKAELIIQIYPTVNDTVPFPWDSLMCAQHEWMESFAGGDR